MSWGGTFEHALGSSFTIAQRQAKQRIADVIEETLRLGDTFDRRVAFCARTKWNPQRSIDVVTLDGKRVAVVTLTTVSVPYTRWDTTSRWCLPQLRTHDDLVRFDKRFEDMDGPTRDRFALAAAVAKQERAR